jgi:hypothetical protein
MIANVRYFPGKGEYLSRRKITSRGDAIQIGACIYLSCVSDKKTINKMIIVYDT